MRRSLVAAGLSLVFGLMMLGGVSAATGDIQGGNPVIQRAEVDSYHDFYLVDKNDRFDADGDVDEWEVYAKNTNQVQLVIYRNSGGWSEVGHSQLRTPVVGYNHFTLDDPISVHAGDYVGLYFPDAGSVAFSLNGAFDRGNLLGTVLLTNQDGGKTDFAYSSNRVYSVRASGTGDEDEDNGDDEDDDEENGDGQDRVGVCHATGNGFVFIEVSRSGWENGHDGHEDDYTSSDSDCRNSDSSSASARGEKDKDRGNGRNNR